MKPAVTVAAIASATVAATLLDLSAHAPLAAEAGVEANHASVGAAIIVRPEFPGSDSADAVVAPALDLSHGRWFWNGDGLGAHLLKAGSWQLSASLDVDLDRREEADAAHLRGLGDVDRALMAKLTSAYAVGPWRVTLSMASDVSDEGHGTIADATLGFQTRPATRLSIDYGMGLRWVNDQYARTFFGVDQLQAARSTLQPYTAKAGISEARAFVRGTYVFERPWVVSVGAGFAALQGDAADSPIVHDDDYLFFDAALLYRF